MALWAARQRRTALVVFIRVLLATATLAVLALPAHAQALIYFGNEVSATSNFGANEQGVTISRASLDGTNFDRNWIRVGARLHHLTERAGNLFWAIGCTPPAQGSNELCQPPGVVGRVGVDGSGFRSALVDNAEGAEVIGADSTHIYWLESLRPWIARARLDGSEVDHRWYDAEDALDGSFVGVPNDLHLDDDYIYVSSQYAITRIAKDRSSYQTHFVPTGDVCCTFGMALDDSYIYFGRHDERNDTGSIGRVSKDGTGLDMGWIQGPIDGPERPFDLEVNASHVYWTDTTRGGGIGAVGRARLDGTGVEPELIRPPNAPLFFPAGLALDVTPVAPEPSGGSGSGPPGDPNDPGGGGSGDPADPTVGVSSVCIELRGGTRKRTKAVPGGGQVLQTVSQSSDPSVPIKITAGARRGVKIATATFKVNKKAVASTGTTALVPVGALKIGKRNRVSVDLVLTNGKKITVNEIITVIKCPLPPVTCQRILDGTRLKCSSSMPRRARSVKVTVAGPSGAKAGGSAKVKLRKDGKKGDYSMTMKPKGTLPPGRYVYKHVATTTRRGEKLLAVRILTLE